MDAPPFTPPQSPGSGPSFIPTASVPPTPPTNTVVNPRRNKKPLIIGAVILAVVIIILATLFSSYLTTKIAPGKKFKILGASNLTAGQTATITWDASPENVKQYPSEKIEYCTGTFLKQKCTLLAAAAPNTGKALVKVPTSLANKKGVLKFTPRDPQQKIIASISGTSGAVTVKPASSTASSGGSGGGAGGGGGGGSGGDGGGSSSTSNSGDSNKVVTQPTAGIPSAEFIAPLDDEAVALGEALDVRVKLTETSSNKILCQQWLLDGNPIATSGWVGGQSPDLSAGPCQ